MAKKRSFLSIGLAILKRDVIGGGGSYSLVFVKDFAPERQIEVDIELETGEYIIIPRSSGCTLRKPLGVKAEPINKMLDLTGELNPWVELQAKDIFRRLDKIMINNSLDYPEF